MVKKRSLVIASIVTLAVLLGVAFYLWTSTGNPTEALDKRIASTPLGDDERRQLLLDFDDFIENNFPTAVTPKTQASQLLELRTRRAIEEIRTTVVPEGSMRVWYIYNMGVVIKTHNATIGIDVAGTYEAPDIEEVGGLLDLLVITHPHSDHLDAKVAATAAKVGAKIVVADEKAKIVHSTTTSIIRDPEGTGLAELLAGSELASDALIGVEPWSTIEIDGIKITAIPATHTSTTLDVPVDWFYIEASGFGILHTGDGYFPDERPDLTGKRVDLYLVHYVDEIFAEDYYELAPQSRVMVPLHLHELGHGEDITSYAMYVNALEQEKNGHLWLEHMTPQDTGIDYTPMIWGENMSLTH
jgi:L-ascorbate metabolism protein UlaG (beta-lactamase superfamily)